MRHELVNTNILMDIDVGGFGAFPFFMVVPSGNPFLALRSMMSVGCTTIFFEKFALLFGFLGIDSRETAPFNLQLTFAKARFLLLRLPSG